MTGDRGLLILAIVGAVGAAAVGWGATGYHQRDQLQAYAGRICAATGAPYAAKLGATAAGQACADRIDQLAAFERDTNRESARLMADALAARTTKIGVDAAAARDAAQAARDAAQRMEAADAAVQQDHVGPDWFGALNQSGGLRPPR